jgi:hypothetical protein
MELAPQLPPINISVVITQKEGKPCIELRRAITETELLKLVVSCAFWGQPLVMIPKFNNSIKCMSSLVDKGVLYRKGDSYHFLI